MSNIFLNWVLIFGKFGMPAMGIKGAAIATVMSGAIEVLTLFCYLHVKQHLLAFGVDDIRRVIEWNRVIKFLKLSLPTTFNFLAWAGGLFVYHAIMGQSGVQGLAALSVMTPVESIALALLIGMSNAAAVLVGNQIGAKNYDAVYYQAIGVTLLSLLVGVVVAILLFFVQSSVLDGFSALSAETRALFGGKVYACIECWYCASLCADDDHCRRVACRGTLSSVSTKIWLLNGLLVFLLLRLRRLS